MRRLLIGAAFVILAAPAFARNPQDFGPYICSPVVCAQGDLGAQGYPANQVLPEVLYTITTTKITDQYVAGDTVTVCDGTTCVQAVYVLGGGWLHKKAPFKDPHIPYKNNTTSTQPGAVTGLCAICQYIPTYYQYYWEPIVVFKTGTVDIIPLPDDAVGPSDFGFGPDSGYGPDAGAWGLDSVPGMSNAAGYYPSGYVGGGPCSDHCIQPY